MTTIDPIQIVLDAYREGAFPMADPDSGEIDFFGRFFVNFLDLFSFF